MKSNIKISLLTVAIFLCGLFTTNNLSATHVVGGNLYYQCLGNNMYKVTLEFRRDCFNGAEDAQFDDPASIAIYSNGELQQLLGRSGQLFIPFSSSDTLNEILTSECRVFGEDVCVHTTTYSGEIELPANENGYTLVYQRCCRNNTLNNIIDPLRQGATYSVDISPEAMASCNSSPVFKNWPDIYLCNNDMYSFDHSAFDRNGDSLVYELCTPFVGGTIGNPKPIPAAAPPYNSVAWQPPYNENNMMGGTVPLSIDSETGLLTVHPDLVGQFVIGVCVKEYRNGELLSMVKRDFEFNTRVCNSAPMAEFEAIPNPNCSGLSVDFVNASTEERTYLWYFDYSSDRSLTSTEKNPGFTYDESGLYRVRLEVSDGECTDVFEQGVGVSTPDDIDVDFIVSSESCDGDFIFRFLDNSTSSQGLVGFDWSIEYGSFSATVQGGDATVILPKEDNTARVVYTVTGRSGCTKTIRRNIDLHVLNSEPVADTIRICRGGSTPLIAVADEDFTYMWTPEDYLDLTDPRRPIASPPTNTVYAAWITDGICSTRVDITVLVDTDPDFSLTVSDTQIRACYDEIITITAENSAGLDIVWLLEGRELATGNTLSLPVKEDRVFTAIATDAVGCSATQDVTVEVAAPIEFDVDGVNGGEINYCFNENFTMQASGTPGLNYVWVDIDGGQLASGSEYTVEGPEDRIVRLIASNDFGCSEEQTINVNVYEEFDISFASEEVIYCQNEPARIEIATSEQASITWKDSEGNVIGVGTNLSYETDAATTVTAEATSTNGCLKTQMFTLAPFGIDFINPVSEEICAGETIEIGFLDNDITTPLTFEWNNEGTVSNFEPVGNLTVNPTSTTTYVVSVTTDNGCMWVDSTEVIVNSFDDVLTATADPVRIALGQTVDLSTEDYSGVEYSWTPPEIMSNPNSANTTATPTDAAGMYTVTATDMDGCTATASINIQVETAVCDENDVWVPNMFTPNGDGLNDVFKAESNFVEEYELTVYSRWGEQLFISRNIETGWDGTYRGKELEPDVYGYCVRATCTNGVDYVTQGNVTIVK